MKKIILTGALALTVLFASTVNAQETAKNDKQYGPKAGSWGIGISANPILTYFGNFFGKTANNNAPAWNSLTQNNQIVGRYFLKDNMAIRAKFHFGFMSSGETDMVDNRSIDQSSVTFPNLRKEVENSWKHSSYNFGIAGGLEWRTDFKRLQLFYGGELGVGFSGVTNKYTYGNKLAPNAKIPVTISADDNMNGGANINSPDATYNVASRTLKSKDGNQVSIGLRGFFGVEYFVLPKISIAGEFGWGLAYSMGGQSSINYESIGMKKGATKPSVETIDEKGTVKNNGFGASPALNNQLFGAAGTISVNFYF